MKKPLMLLSFLNLAGTQINSMHKEPRISRRSKKQHNITKKNSILDQEALRKLNILEFISTLQDINQIRILSSQNENSIKNVALIEYFRNEISILSRLFQSGVLVDVIKDNKHNAQCIILSVAYTLSGISNLKFIKNNLEVLFNADKIADYNKVLSPDLSKEKKNQYIWLAINKLAPNLVFALSRMYNEKCDISKALFSYDKLKTNTNIFMILKTITNISEFLRKNQLYKLQSNGYKTHKPEV
ncbi:MAG: hypothetical protein M0R03_16645 [Novosphingobium sp.]|nr:hypothetical protein [Novosphingobium sp.]